RHRRGRIVLLSFGDVADRTIPPAHPRPGDVDPSDRPLRRRRRLRIDRRVPRADLQLAPLLLRLRNRWNDARFHPDVALEVPPSPRATETISQHPTPACRFANPQPAPSQ